MSIRYEESVDALYITLKKGKVLRTKEEDGYLADYDKKGDLLGLEILNYSKKTRFLKGLVMGRLEKTGRGIKNRVTE